MSINVRKFCVSQENITVLQTNESAIGYVFVSIVEKPYRRTKLIVSHAKNYWECETTSANVVNPAEQFLEFTSNPYSQDILQKFGIKKNAKVLDLEKFWTEIAPNRLKEVFDELGLYPDESLKLFSECPFAESSDVYMSWCHEHYKKICMWIGNGWENLIPLKNNPDLAYFESVMNVANQAIHQHFFPVTVQPNYDFAWHCTECEIDFSCDEECLEELAKKGIETSHYEGAYFFLDSGFNKQRLEQGGSENSTFTEFKDGVFEQKDEIFSALSKNSLFSQFDLSKAFLDDAYECGFWVTIPTKFNSEICLSFNICTPNKII